MKIVIDIGGSILASPRPDLEYIKNFAEFLVELSAKNEVFVVVGGGEVARKYILVAKKLGAGNEYCDEIGILATKLNAMLLLASLKKLAKANKKIPESIEEVPCNQKIFIMGGTKPGQTTDAVAAGIARKCKADLLVIATNVDGIYEEDPKKNPLAKRFEKLSFSELLEFVKNYEHEPGFSGVIDKTAAKIIAKDKIKTVVVNGKKIENIRKAIEEQKGGTLIC